MSHAADDVKKNVVPGDVKPDDLAGAIWQLADSVMITDREGLIEYVNHAFTDTTGYTHADVVGKTPRVLKSGLHSTGFYQRMWASLLAGRVFRDVIVNRRKDGNLYYEEKAVTPLRDAGGRITRFISTGRDVTARIEKQERIEHLAYHDPLTGLPNRALFVDRLKHAVAHAKRNGTTLAVFYLDLDGFKEINDRHGHEVGDKFLRSVAARLRASVRVTDTVARLGGDEFVVLVEKIEHPQDIALTAEKISTQIALPIIRGGHALGVRASIGVGVYPQDGTTASALIRAADKAMYVAKARSKNASG